VRISRFVTDYTNILLIKIVSKFVRAYNDTLHSTTGMAPSHVTDSDVFAIWKKMEAKRRRVAMVRFSVGQHVRISKNKMNYANCGEHNFSTEIFQITKVIQRRPRPVYELEDLNRTQIVGQFYVEEMTPIRILKQTTYRIEKY